MARLSIVKVAVAGGLVAMLAQLLSIWLQDFYPLAASRLIVGIGLGACFAATNAAVAHARNPDRVYGIAVASTLVVMAVIFFPVLGKAIASNSQRGAFFVMAIIVLIATVSFRWLRISEGELKEKPVSTAISVPAVAVLFAVMSFFTLGTSAIWAFTERIGVDVGLQTSDIAVYLGLSSLSGCASALLAAWIGPRFGRGLPAMCMLLVSALSCIAIINISNDVTFIIALVLYWVGYMFLYPFLMSIAAAMDPSGRVAAAAGGVMALVFAFGPALGGLIAALSSYTMIGVVGALTCTAGAVLAFAARSVLDVDHGARVLA
jgi:predicted MFS family arabinose efflux permease